ncbi:MAG: hypothetical protein ACOC53_08185 [Candidatus Saliniplasma sp.]
MDPGQTKNYNYNYTDVALEEDVELDEGVNEFSYDSEISLDAYVHSVKPCDKVNNIRIGVSALGAYRYNEEESISNPNDGDLYTTPFGHVGTLGTAIEAEITGMEGYEGEEGDTGLQIQTRYNSADNFTDGDGDAGDPGTPLSEWQELAIEGGLLLAETYVDMNTLNALSWAQYAYKVGSTYAEEDPIDPLPEHKISESGEDASISQSWEHIRTYMEEREYHLFNLNYWEYEEHLEEGPVDQELVEAFYEKGHEIADWSDLEEEDDEWKVVTPDDVFTLERDEDKLKIYGEDIPLERAHTASTMIYFELPTDDLPDEATLEISAKNVLGTADVEGEITEAADGAEASVEIPIRNAEPDPNLVEDLDTDKEDYEASESSNTVYPDFEGLTVETPAGFTEPEYQVEIEWNPEWDSGWETLTYDWLTYGEEIDKNSVAINGIPDDGDEYGVSIKYTIEVGDEYGGWEMETITETHMFTVTNEGDDDGGGGGGGVRPPPGGGVSPMGNETGIG